MWCRHQYIAVSSDRITSAMLDQQRAVDVVAVSRPCLNRLRLAENPTYPQARLFFLFLFFYFRGKKLLPTNCLDMVTGTNRGTTGTNRG